MIKLVKWGPDTCECLVECTYDDSTVFDEYTLNAVIKKCTNHSGLNNENLYQTLVKENKSKNLFIKSIIENIGGISENDIPKLKWSFDGTDDKRKLTFNLEDLSEHKESIRSLDKSGIPINIDVI